MHELQVRTFRANPRLELVPFERLSDAERGWLAPCEADPGFYGVLRPRIPPSDAGGAGLGIKSVDRDTALLFLTLREPGPLPAYLRRSLGAEAGRVAARLVADGVLEVVDGAGFVAGAAALPLLAAEPEEAALGRGRTAALSLAALRYGADLVAAGGEGPTPIALSERLYGYNRLPLTPDWKRRLDGPGGAPALLGLDAGGGARAALDRGWREAPTTRSWHAWQARAASPGAGVAYKLYVSALPAALPEAVPEILAGLAAARSPLFKVGAGAAGLLRPDKMVAYFPDLEALLRGAEELRGRLAGVPAQGVPFTAGVDEDGLLSWGMDPPAAAQSPLWGGRESWRFWLTNRLARALLAARAAGSAAAPAEPWRFALARLRLEGVDVASWTPGAALFAPAEAGGD